MAGNGTGIARQVGHTVERSVRRSRPWVVACGRCGYAAEGVVYALIGVLAVQVALGRGGATTDNRGALVWIAQAPHGRLALSAVALGIVGFALWCFLQAALDTDQKGSDVKGLLARVGQAGVGVLHVGLALSALRLLRAGTVGATSDAAAKGWTARFLSHPFGPWLVALGGLLMLGGGIYQLYQGYTATFREDLQLGQLDPTAARWVLLLGRLGYAARGVVFGLIGGFLVYAARRADPGEARGLDGVLATLAQQPSGPWLLGSVAVGFVAYGLFLFAQARYRRMVIT